MDINKAGEKVEQASGFFDKVNQFIKKHPIWFIVILIVAFFYWASTLPDTEEEYYEDDYYYEEEYYSEPDGTLTDTLNYYEDGIQVKY